MIFRRRWAIAFSSAGHSGKSQRPSFWLRKP